jgi:prenyltransferase beta subunit
MRFSRFVVVAMLIPALAVSVRSAEPDENPKNKRGLLDEETKKATAAALEWIAKQQNADGSFGDSRYPHNTAVTGFSLLAFMAQGHVPNQGKYGPEVAKGCRFLLGSARESDGYIVGTRGGNMYCHGMATLALSQLWGMTGDEEVKKTLKKAVDLIVRCQADNGGWRYEPVPSGADISVTIMQVMALRGAKDSGINVPDKTLKKALEYINTCYDPGTGGYTYMPFNRQPGFARTAAGICVLKLVGEYDKKIDRSVEYLKKTMENPREHFWYGHYYACHAMHQVGGNGSWSQRNYGGGAGPVYQTAIAVIALSVPCNYLPIFQR